MKYRWWLPVSLASSYGVSYELRLSFWNISFARPKLPITNCPYYNLNIRKEEDKTDALRPIVDRIPCFGGGITTHFELLVQPQPQPQPQRRWVFFYKSGFELDEEDDYHRLGDLIDS